MDLERERLIFKNFNSKEFSMEIIDIYRSAQLLIKRYQYRAYDEAINKVAELRVAGDELGAHTWLRISQAVLDLCKNESSGGRTIQ